MRVAVFSDVHGNPYACEAVLEAIEAEGDMDVIVAAGDLCLGGSDPARCVDLLMSAGALGVIGNTEEYIFAPASEPDDESHRRKWGFIQLAAYWVRSKLSSQQMSWLETLPFEQRFSPSDTQSEGLLVVHANPFDVEFHIYPPETDQKKLWGEVRQPDNDPELSHYFKGIPERVIAFGHFHYPSIRPWQSKLLVNVASCSLPGVDHDPRARYSVFTWENRKWTIAQRSLDYGAEREIAALRASNMPSKAFFTRYFGDNL